MLIFSERHITMGSNLQNPDGDSEETDPEKILEFTRTPRKAPEYKPRSMSLDDLPGGIRVPIVMKQQQRLKPKLQENLAGLEELKLLKEKQQLLVNSAKSLVVPRKEQTDNAEVDRRPLRSPRRVSCGNLSSISEENTLSFQNGFNNNVSLNQGRNRRPLSVSDVNYIQEEFNDTGNLSENRNGSCSSEKSSTSAEFSLSSCASDDGETVDEENKVTNFIYHNKIHKPLHRSASDNWCLNRQDFANSFVSRNNLSSGRRASVQVDSDVVRPRFHENKGFTEQIEPKLRRASMQCDAIITKPDGAHNMSKLISDIKLNYNFPCPLHAVMRQYGSSSAGIQMNSENQPKDSGKTEQEKIKNAKELVEEWQAVPRIPKHNPKEDTTRKYKQSDFNVDSAENDNSFFHVPRDLYNDSLGNFKSVREQSFTSDYFGSMETVNSIKSLPTSAFRTRSVIGSQSHSGHVRRHSLPAKTSVTSPMLEQSAERSVVNRNGRYLGNKTCYSDSANVIDNKLLTDKTRVPNSEIMENEVFSDTKNDIDTSDENNSYVNSEKDKKLDLVLDEGYSASVPNSPNSEILPAVNKDSKHSKLINSLGNNTAHNVQSHPCTVKKGLLETAL